MMKKILKENTIFLVPYLVLMIAVTPFLIVIPKSDLHLWINSYYSNFSDCFFRVITFVGDGVFVCTVGALLLLFSIRNSLLVFSSWLLSGLIVQIFKRLVFSDAPRPSAFFEGYSSLHVVSGVELLGSRSFPSGHSASAFALFLSLALITGNKTLKILCLLAAVIVAFSRVYLSQHFLADIVAGSLTGVAASLIAFWFISRRHRHWYDISLYRSITHRSGRNA